MEEAVAAGIEHIVFVTSPHQDAVSAYFGRIPGLEAVLGQRGDAELLQRMVAVSEMADFSYVRQSRPLGTGHAILSAREAVGVEPFAVLFPDDLIWGDPPTIGAMMRIFDDRQSSVISVREVSDEQVPSLGIVDSRPVDGRLSEVLSLVEKPSLAESPSNLAIVGRYVLTPLVFEMLERTPTGAGGEIQITDAISMLLTTGRAYGYRFPGVHFDVGTPLGLLKASVYAGLNRAEVAAELREWLAHALEGHAQ